MKMATTVSTRNKLGKKIGKPLIIMIMAQNRRQTSIKDSGVSQSARKFRAKENNATFFPKTLRLLATFRKHFSGVFI